MPRPRAHAPSIYTPMELLFYVSAVNNIFALCGIAGCVCATSAAQPHGTL